MSTWGERIKVPMKDQVALHVKRWQLWNEFIDYCIEKGFEDSPDDRVSHGAVLPGSGDEHQFQLALMDGNRSIMWKKRLLRRGGEPAVLFDCSFGSVNSTSDLDVSVIATDSRVMRLWIKWVPLPFCETWDSNFYFEPGISTADTVVSWTNMLPGFEWTTPESASYELQCIEAYTRAYSEGRQVEVEGRRTTPNPTDISPSQELDMYRTCMHFAEAFRAACESGRGIRRAFLNYGLSKTEGLVSYTSLAICGVFGKKVQDDFILKTGSAAYLNREPYLAALGAYEMLCNLRMHRTTGGYKSKYANRLMRILEGNPELCRGHERVKPLQKKNDMGMLEMLRALGFVLDYMDGIAKEEYVGVCSFVGRLKHLAKKIDLDELCAQLYGYLDAQIKADEVRGDDTNDYLKELFD